MCTVLHIEEEKRAITNEEQSPLLCNTKKSQKETHTKIMLSIEFFLKFFQLYVVVDMLKRPIDGGIPFRIYPRTKRNRKHKWFCVLCRFGNINFVTADFATSLPPCRRLRIIITFSFISH